MLEIFLFSSHLQLPGLLLTAISILEHGLPASPSLASPLPLPCSVPVLNPSPYPIPMGVVLGVISTSPREKEDAQNYSCLTLKDILFRPRLGDSLVLCA